MSRKAFIIILAVCIALMPFLGFPSSWEDAFYACAGTLILLLSINWGFLRRKKSRPNRSKKAQPSAGEAFVESAPKSAGNGTEQ